jgi:ubiquinone/menaquinone biosynthesis C-methylase UbiE
MTALKTRLKKIIETTAGTAFTKRVHYNYEKGIRYFKNQQFKKSNPFLKIPPDEFLFETFQLDYQKYFYDGALAAKEILKWTEAYIPQEMPTILDWGCGTGRIIQHLHQFHPYALLYGADTNPDMIAWDQKQINDVYFTAIANTCPTTFPLNYFDLIYGISVFTHLSATMQTQWIQELARITKPGGILLVTTMGLHYEKQLLKSEKTKLIENGIVEKEFRANKLLQIGNRNYAVYETAAYFEAMIKEHFTVLQYFEGLSNPDKFGGQDLWILQKK